LQGIESVSFDSKQIINIYFTNFHLFVESADTWRRRVRDRIYWYIERVNMWIVVGVMGALVLLVLMALIIMLVRKDRYSLQRGARPEKRRKYGSSYQLQRGGRPEKRKEYGSSYELQRGGHQKRRRLNDRTGRLQRGGRPTKRPNINLD
jgi:hypothetical protein